MGFQWDTFMDNTPYPLEAVNLSWDTKGERNHDRPPLFRLGVAIRDVVLDELNELKRERESDQKRLASLIQTKEQLAKMVDIEASLKDLCARIVPDLEHCPNEDKKDAYTYLAGQGDI